jgi:hypothetical protein
MAEKKMQSKVTPFLALCHAVYIMWSHWWLSTTNAVILVNMQSSLFMFINH